MDNTSIITQASREDAKSRVTVSSLSEKTQKKGKSRGSRVLKDLVCCFTGSKTKETPASHANGGVSAGYSPSAAAAADTNGHQSPGTEASPYILPAPTGKDANKKCMVLDLDETLVHSSFKPINNADFVVPVEIDGTIHQVYVLKRPHVDEFLQKIGDFYEVVLFTASLAKYADPVADLLDKWGVFKARLFRESCVLHRGNYVKDLSRLGRDLKNIVIVDNSPASYVFHPDNAVPVASWFDDMADTELLDLIPFFERLSKADSVYTVLCGGGSDASDTQNHNQHNNHLLPHLHQPHVLQDAALASKLQSCPTAGTANDAQPTSLSEVVTQVPKDAASTKVGSGS